MGELDKSLTRWAKGLTLNSRLKGSPDPSMNKWSVGRGSG